MPSKQLKRNLIRIYLILVPVLVSIFGFGIGHISYKIYLPVWILNVILMITAVGFLGGGYKKKPDLLKQWLFAGAFFLIAPWMLISMFFGLGPPPETAAGWISTALEQQVRYAFLMIAGLGVVVGFAVLRDKLRDTTGNFYSLLGFIAIIIAIPIFIINMSFWGGYLVEAFQIPAFAASSNEEDWFAPVRNQFGLLSVAEVTLTYLSTAAFAASLHAAGWFRKTPSRIYIVLSLLFVLLILLPPWSEPIATAGYFLTIPAIPFLMPYLMGINLLRIAGE